ncbi:hypothetical protein [Ornithinimicrobium kibberense]|uniref:hypothetical protein n=1 Tax=Ornithinimicrobium kibberense TaxID=282060 RepID=UPI00361943D6
MNIQTTTARPRPTRSARSWQRSTRRRKPSEHHDPRRHPLHLPRHLVSRGPRVRRHLPRAALPVLARTHSGRGTAQPSRSREHRRRGHAPQRRADPRPTVLAQLLGQVQPPRR